MIYMQELVRLVWRVSREASKVVFVENTETVQILRKNIEELNCQKNK